MNAEDILFLLYTSGSTGKPKGLAHSQAGYLLYASVTQQVTHNSQSDRINLIAVDLEKLTDKSCIFILPFWKTNGTACRRND